MSNIDQQSEKQLSLRDVVYNIKRTNRYLKSKRIAILIVAFVGALVGLAYSIFKKPVYTASCTFVIDDGNRQGGALSQLAGLASITGLGQNGVGGVFQGDNILELYKSRSMIEKALLSEVNVEGKNALLIDRYISFNHLAEKWKQKQLYNVTFTGNPEKFSRVQDSIISDIAGGFNKKNLNVTKPDKKLGIIKVEFESPDELFAKEFTDKLVEKVSDFYIETTTKKSAQNVRVLQHQADSVRTVLNLSIGDVASSIDAAPNANPLLLSLRVPSQRKQVDVQAGSAVYAEIIKNLEIAKISLRQEMPLIQVIDRPVFPLTKAKTGKIKGVVAGAILSSILVICYLLVVKVYRLVTDPL